MLGLAQHNSVTTYLRRYDDFPRPGDRQIRWPHSPVASPGDRGVASAKRQRMIRPMLRLERTRAACFVTSHPYRGSASHSEAD